VLHRQQIYVAFLRQVKLMALRANKAVVVARKGRVTERTTPGHDDSSLIERAKV
jgi:hypothetical protein